MSNVSGLEGQAQVDRWQWECEMPDEYHATPAQLERMANHDWEHIEPSLYDINGMLLTDLKKWHRQSLPDWHFEQLYGEKK